MSVATAENNVRREMQELLDEQDGLRPLVEELTRAAELGDGTMQQIAERWLRLWNNSLERHCRDEEARLVLWIPGSPLLDRLHAEHGALRSLARALETAPTAALLQEVADLLGRHLDWERDELMPAVASAMGFDPVEFAEVN